jgi:hypothetical protein
MLTFTKTGFSCSICLSTFAQIADPCTAPAPRYIDSDRQGARAYRPNAVACESCDRKAVKVPFRVTWANWTMLDI